MAYCRLPQTGGIAYSFPEIGMLMHGAQEDPEDSQWKNKQ